MDHGCRRSAVPNENEFEPRQFPTRAPIPIWTPMVDRDNNHHPGPAGLALFNNGYLYISTSELGVPHHRASLVIHPTQTRRRPVFRSSLPKPFRFCGLSLTRCVPVALCASIFGTYLIFSSTWTTCIMPSVILEIDSSPKFAFFVTQPPKKKRAAVNNTFRAPALPINPSRAILAWANDVLPGSPVPMTPTPGVSLSRSTSFVSSPLLQAFRRSSLNRANSRRQSTSSIRSKISTASFLQFADPPRTSANPMNLPATPFPADVKVDLTAFGYTSSFVDISVSTPITPEIYRPKPTTRVPGRRNIAGTRLPTAPPPKSKTPRMLKRLLGTKSKAVAQAHIKRAADHLNPSVSDSVFAFPEKLRTSAGSSFASVEIANTDGTKDVGTVHRGELGQHWWNQQEEWESTPVLPPTGIPLSAQYPNAEGWVTYNHLKEFEREGTLERSPLPSTKHKDLYHSCPLLVTDDEAQQFVRGRAMRCTSVAGSIVLPSPSVEAPNILLAIPSRPKRGRHLKPGFLKDVIAVPPTPTPPSAHLQASCSPRSPVHPSRFIINTSATPGSVRRQRSRSRSLSRRKRKPAPPPLKIIPICPVNKLAINVGPEEEDRKVLLEDSLKPSPHVVASRWSRETTTPGLLPARSGDLDNQVDDSALADAPRKSRRLGRFFKGGEREFLV